MIEEANSKLKPLHGAGKSFFLASRSQMLIFRLYGYEKSR